MTLFTSEKNKKATKRTLFIYIGLTLFTMLFCGVYEANSRGVYSAHMAHAWAWLLLIGVGMYLLLFLLPIKTVPGILPSSIYNFGVAMITMRSIYIGVVEIYGTARSQMSNTYLVVALIPLIIGFSCYVFILIKELIKQK